MWKRAEGGGAKGQLGWGRGGTPNVLGVLPLLYEARRTTAKIGNGGSLRKELYFFFQRTTKELADIYS